MNKTDLISAVAEKAGMTKKDTGKIINTTVENIMEYLSEEAKKEKRDKVQIVGFGTFEARNRKERKGKNPQTGEAITIPERTVPVFRAGKSFKEAVEG